MTKKKEFKDPLEDIDPVMEDAFSSADDDFDDELDDEKDNNGPVVAQIQFPAFEEQVAGKKVEDDIFGNIPVNISVELGRTEMSLKEVYELTEGSIIELERLVGEPMDLIVNGQIIAQGEVVAVDNNYGLRLTNIISKSKA
jgi:flagellar motor switch protein FliN/FliY